MNSSFSGKLVIASRESRLAMWQAEHVRARLLELYPHSTVEILGMTTRGDAPPNAAQSAALASLLQTAGPVLARTAGVLGDVDRVNQKLRGTGVQLNPSVPPVRDGKLADQDEE